MSYKGKKFIDGEKDFIIREKEFKVKLQALIIQREEKKKREITEKEKIEKVERERIDKPCEDLLQEKIVPVAEPDIDINSSSEKPCEGFFEKEKKEGEIVEKFKSEESLITYPINTAKTKSLKGDWPTLNSFFTYIMILLSKNMKTITLLCC